ncbi:MAG: sigma-70 family RNA polymerase sigma factor [Candidatus Poribacteria bacterium]|nr:sigma-70 family RNA polymerase sigma factor [Candidatus Poribacteria bacterium]
MSKDDVELIHTVLSGDDEAFTTLVRKYQKSVHALAWRKVGDFHFAEEITQDAFLRAYKGLPKLKDPSQFSGWLYVITARLCKDWHENNKSIIKLEEEASVLEIQRMSYNRYISDKNKKEGHERRHKVVKKLLEKLPESERTVMTLYYLGEMTAKEIGNFLGVSVNTITSRLQRARKRLEKEEELLVQEILGGVQLPDGLTEDIARKVSDTKLTPSPTGKPFLPWMAFGAAAVLVLLLLSASNQYLVRFQKPYSFEAQSEPTIEIIDAPAVLDIEAKPAVRNQTGRADTTNQSGTASVQVSEPVLAANAQGELLRPSAAQWMQATGPQGGPVFDIFATSEGALYAFSPTEIYRLAANTTTWVPVDIDASTEGPRVPMIEHQGTLYIVATDTVFASTDNGETWRTFCSRPEGNAIGFIIVDGIQRAGSDITMYLALRNKGVFRATDAGKQWTLLDNGLKGNRTISTLATIRNTVFAGTDKGLYRLDDSGAWERLFVGVPGPIYALAVSEDNLYIGTGPDFLALQQVRSEPTEVMRTMYDNNLRLSRVFYSADLGASWTEITPTDIIAPSGISLLVAGKTILVQTFTQFRSTDSGQTWTELGFEIDSLKQNAFPSVATDENTFYKATPSGIYRTTDAGKSWHLFMDGMVGTGILDLVALNSRLYAHAGGEIVQSIDSGESWESVPVEAKTYSHKPVKVEQSHFPEIYTKVPADSQLTIAGNMLYVISPEKDNLRVFCLSADGDALIPVQGESDVLSIELLADNEYVEQVHLSRSHEGDNNAAETLRRREHERIGAFAVSRGTLYAEYKRQLFKWKPGDAAWKDTGLLDTGEQPEADLKCGFRLAVSGETVYVGKRDGKLFQSQDAGNSWRDITPNLPSRFTCFKDIVFARSTVYIATDSGVLVSTTGEHWRVITDKIVIDRFAVDGSTIYGAGDTGVYRLDVHDKWERVSPVVPGQVLSLVVDRDRLYVATKHRGMFHISLEQENYALSQK